MLSPCNTTVDGTNRELLAHGTGAFPVGCYHDDLCRGEVVWHWHEELEAAVVSEGSVAVTIGSQTCTLHTGDGFFVNTGVLHAARAAEEGPCRLHSLVFHPRLVGGSLDSVFYQAYLLPLMHTPDQTNFYLSGGDPARRPALEMIERAWQACAGEGPHFELAVRASLSELVALLLDYRQAVPHGSEEGRTLRDSERIKTMLAFVHSHFAEPLTVADIARSAAVSPSECLRCFRRTIGRTPAQYLRDCRLRRAAELLSGTDLPVAQVAADCGFDDVSYFTRVFRACRQATPTAYRRGGVQKAK